MRTWIGVPQVNNGDEWVCIRGSWQEVIVKVCIWLTVRERYAREVLRQPVLRLKPLECILPLKYAA